MADTLDLTVTLRGELKDFVLGEVRSGRYESAEEYVRDTLRRRHDARADWTFEETKAELQRAFAAPRERYSKVTAQDIFASYDPE